MYEVTSRALQRCMFVDVFRCLRFNVEFGRGVTWAANVGLSNFVKDITGFSTRKVGLVGQHLVNHVIE